jgi:hypothetical protein
VWEGGIAFNCVYWTLILILFFALLYLFRQKFKWRLLTERLDGLEDPPPQLKRSGSSSLLTFPGLPGIYRNCNKELNVRATVVNSRVTFYNTN